MLGITNVSNAPSIVLKGTQVSNWTSGSYNGYSYRGTIPLTGVTADMIAEVTFSQAQAESGNYSSVCTTFNGGLYIYAKVNTTIEIPSIIIHSIVESYYEMDNSPVSGSTKAVTSGGVYTALDDKVSVNIPITGTTTGNIVYATVGDANGVRLQLRLYNNNTGFYSILELKTNNDGSTQVFVQKRRTSDGTYMGGTELCNFQS